jgi:hypothetical protein
MRKEVNTSGSADSLCFAKLFTKPSIPIHQKHLKTSRQFSGSSLFTKLQYYEHTSPVKDWTDEQADPGCHLRTRLHK